MTRETKTATFAIISFFLFIFIAWSFSPSAGQPTSFADCAALGFPVLETFPRKCLAPQRETFEEDLSGFESLLITPSKETFFTTTTSPQQTTTPETIISSTTSPNQNNPD